MRKQPPAHLKFSVHSLYSAWLRAYCRAFVVLTCAQAASSLSTPPQPGGGSRDQEAAVHRRRVLRAGAAVRRAPPGPREALCDGHQLHRQRHHGAPLTRCATLLGRRRQPAGPKCIFHHAASFAPKVFRLKRFDPGFSLVPSQKGFKKFISVASNDPATVQGYECAAAAAVAPPPISRTSNRNPRVARRESAQNSPVPDFSSGRDPLLRQVHARLSGAHQAHRRLI